MRLALFGINLVDCIAHRSKSVAATILGLALLLALPAVHAADGTNPSKPAQRPANDGPSDDAPVKAPPKSAVKSRSQGDAMMLLVANMIVEDFLAEGGDPEEIPTLLAEISRWYRKTMSGTSTKSGAKTTRTSNDDQ